MTLTGIIKSDGFVETPSGRLVQLEINGISDNGFPKALINAKSVGGSGYFHSQSIEPFMGMKVQFETNDGKHGYNFKIIE